MSISLFIIFVAIAIFLILIGVVLIIASIATGGRRTEGTEVGGVVIIGPLPVVFGSSVRITKIMLVLAVVLTVLAVILALITLRLVVV